MVFHVVTLFPESFDSYVGASIIGRALRNKKIKIKFYNPRDFVPTPKSQKGKEKPYLRVDDKPFGGGPGMVMQAMPILKAIEKAIKNCKMEKWKNGKKNLNSSILKSSIKIIWLSPGGKQFTNDYAEKTIKKYNDVIIICGRYEGIDARVKKVIKEEFKNGRLEEISIGNFVVTGGELPAMILIDCISRQVEGVLGNFNSLEESRVSTSVVYTRPEVLTYKNKKYKVPKVLLSGNHKKIEEWKKTR